MRAIWSGEIVFGLVTVPTRLYSATKDLTPKFHLVHKACGTRVQMVRRCPKCDKDLTWDEIARAYEVSKDAYARFSPEEVAKAEESKESAGTISIVQFMEPREVDPAFIQTSYWVGPMGKSAHGFSLLRSVLEETGQVALAKVAIRKRTRLAILRPRAKLFALDMIRFADELVDAKGIDLPATKTPSDKELALAKSLVAQLTERFDPEKHPDEYRAKVELKAEAKVEHPSPKRAASAQAAKGGAKVIDLSELLSRSLSAKKATSAAKHRAVKAAPAARKAAPRHGVHKRAAG